MVFIPPSAGLKTLRPPVPSSGATGQAQRGLFVGVVQILEERPQLNTLRCHGHEFHGAGSGSKHTKPCRAGEGSRESVFLSFQMLLIEQNIDDAC